MKKDIKVNKGRFVVIKIKGELKHVVEATEGLRIEGGDDIEVVSKTKSQLTKAEIDKIKQK